MNTQPEAMILDAGFASLPLQHALKEAGFATLACSGKADDPGMTYAHRSRLQNYADIDAVLSIACEENIAALVPGVTDVSYLSGCRVASTLGLPGFDSPEVSDTLFLKDKFRAWSHRQGLPIPQAVSDPVQAITLPLPLIVKPVDAYSGKGITLVREWSSLDAAVEAARLASPGGQYVIETFCEGQLYSHSAFIRKGCIACEFFVEEHCTVYPWQVNSSSLNQSLDEAMCRQVSDCMQTIVSELGLVDGLLHTQFIASEKAFWLIELTRRCPGDLYSRLIELSTGMPYSRWFIEPFIGVNSVFPERRPAHRCAIARHTVSTSKETLFSGFQFASLPAHIVEVIPLKAVGEVVKPAPGDRAGLIFAEFNDFLALRQATAQLKNFFSIKAC